MTSSYMSIIVSLVYGLVMGIFKLFHALYKIHQMYSTKVFLNRCALLLLFGQENLRVLISSWFLYCLIYWDDSWAKETI